MKSDFNQQTGEQEKDYSGVHMQQGQIQLDDDWNSQRGDGQCTPGKWWLLLILMLAIVWILICRKRLPEGRPR